MNCPHFSTANSDTAPSCPCCGTPMPQEDAETILIVDPAVLVSRSDFVPRIHIEALLGQGGMVRIYKAYDQEIDRIVAIKVVREGLNPRVLHLLNGRVNEVTSGHECQTKAVP